MFPCSHEKIFWWDRSGKFKKHKEIFLKKTRRKEWRKEKEEISMYVEVPILVCSPWVGNTLGLPPSCNPPSGEPTSMGTTKPKNNRSIHHPPKQVLFY
jgi:hypothetical protein